MLLSKKEIKYIFNKSSNIYISRLGGIGDVMMFLPTLDALINKFPKKNIKLITNVSLDLFRYTYLKKYIVNEDSLYDDFIKHKINNKKYVDIIDINSASFGLSSLHQVDSYLDYFGLYNSSFRNIKTIKNLFKIPKSSFINSSMKKIVLHCSAGDINRTWSKNNYTELIDLLINEGYCVITIGKSINLCGSIKGVHIINNKNLVDFTNKLSINETLQLINECDLLISTDSGPIQLAAATDISILGIYSVVKGENRLPMSTLDEKTKYFEVENDCKNYGCYNKITDKDLQICAINNNTPDLFSNWCFDDQSYKCLEKIKPNSVFKNAKKILNSSKPTISNKHTKTLILSVNSDNSILLKKFLKDFSSSFNQIIILNIDNNESINKISKTNNFMCINNIKKENLYDLKNKAYEYAKSWWIYCFDINEISGEIFSEVYKFKNENNSLNNIVKFEKKVLIDNIYIANLNDLKVFPNHLDLTFSKKDNFQKKIPNNIKDYEVKTFTVAHNIITKKLIFETSNRRKELIFDLKNLITYNANNELLNFTLSYLFFLENDIEDLKKYTRSIIEESKNHKLISLSCFMIGNINNVKKSTDLLIDMEKYYKWEKSTISNSFNLFSNNDFESALDMVNKLLDVSPICIEGMYIKSLILNRLDFNEDSLELLNSIISLGYKNDSIFNQKGIVLLNLNSIQSAIESFQQAIDINPTNHDYYKLRSEAYIILKKYDLAVESLIETLNLFPDDLEAQQKLSSLSKSNVNAC